MPLEDSEGHSPTLLSLGLSTSVPQSIKRDSIVPPQFTILGSSPPLHQNVTLSGNGVFAEVIKLK